MASPTKLTLRLDDELIEDAKAYAARHGRSLSQLVADYFEVLSARRPAGRNPADTPILDDLIGMLAAQAAQAPAGPDDHDRHRQAKHLHDEVR